MLEALVIAKNDDVSKTLLQILAEQLEENVHFECISNTKNLITEIKKRNPDFIVTADLAGFESVTLTDNIAYNLLGCKQIHILFHDRLANEKVLDNYLSIAMFFGVVGTEYMTHLKKIYSRIPWIEELQGWEGNCSVESIHRNKLVIKTFVENIMIESKLL